MQIREIQNNNYSAQKTNFKWKPSLQRTLSIRKTQPVAEKVVKRENFVNKGIQGILLAAAGTPIGLGIGGYIANLLNMSVDRGMISGMLAGFGLGGLIGLVRYLISASNPDNDFPEPSGNSEIVDLFIRAPFTALMEAREERKQQAEYARKYGPPPAAGPSKYIPDDGATIMARELDRERKAAEERAAEVRVRRAHHLP